MISERKNIYIDQLNAALIVSCQPVESGPMDHTEHVVAMAKAAVAGGARALRIEGVTRVKAVRNEVTVPIIGIVKRDLSNFPVRITPYVSDIKNLADAGASIIAFDATDRPRPEPLPSLLNAIHSQDCLSMADCATYEEGCAISSLGCTFIGSTLSGYTCETETPSEPDLELVRRLSADGIKVIAEGRYNTAALAAEAMRMGAYAVTVGSAITRIEHISSWFREAMVNAKSSCTVADTGKQEGSHP